MKKNDAQDNPSPEDQDNPAAQTIPEVVIKGSPDDAPLQPDPVGQAIPGVIAGGIIGAAMGGLPGGVIGAVAGAKKEVLIGIATEAALIVVEAVKEAIDKAGGEGVGGEGVGGEGAGGEGVGGEGAGGEGAGGEGAGGEGAGGEGVGGEGVGGEGAGGEGVGGEGGCFTSHTPIALSNAATKPMYSVQIGDLILSRDEVTGKIAEQKVLHIWTHEVNELLLLKLSNDEEIETTKEHRFSIEDKGFVSAGSLEIGTKLDNYAEKNIQIVAIESRYQDVTVYNIEVDKFHTYFVGNTGVWVHNVKDEKLDGGANVGGIQ
jgi:Pretoxin HINT domain